MMRRRCNPIYHSGFTIVELLVVIVVIGILAALVFISYNGVQSRAKMAVVQSDLARVSKLLETYKLTNTSGEIYPTDLTAAGIKSSDGTTFDYNYTTGGKNYCLTAINGNQAMTITNSDRTPRATSCIYNGIIGWWKLNGNASDSSGNNANGVINGAPTLANGQNGQANGAYYFNGTTDYIAINNFDYGVMRPNAVGASWSLSIWALGGGSYNGGVAFGRAGYNGGFVTSATGYVFTLWKNTSANVFTTHGPVIDSNWHLLAATYEAGLMCFYEDGVFVGSSNVSSLYDYSSTLGIGSGGSNVWRYTGTLDDARVYNRALSAAEITALYNAGAE